MSEFPLSEGDIVADKYRVERCLGIGGMGVVVAAWHLELEQRVAIKFLQGQMDERFEPTKRFRREAKAAAKIHSEHVARVWDVGKLDDGTPFIVMEYLEGNNLAQELRIRSPFPVAEAVDYVLQAIDALAEVHALGIIHRDLKPANLFLTRRPDGSPFVKILDFGISKTVSATEDVGLTQGELLIGSPQYMSPEQLTSAADVDARTDIWSLGAILYKMLTGHPPYTGASVPLIYAALLRDTPDPISRYRADVPEQLEAVILRCLSKDRRERFSSVGELAQSLVEYCSVEARVYADRACRVLSVTSVTPTSSINASLYPPLGSARPGDSNRLEQTVPAWVITALSSWRSLGDGWRSLGWGRWLLLVLALSLSVWLLFGPWNVTVPIISAARAPVIPAAVLNEQTPEVRVRPALARPPVERVAPEALPAPVQATVNSPMPRERVSSKAPPSRPLARRSAVTQRNPEKSPEPAARNPQPAPTPPARPRAEPESTGATLSDFGGRR